MPFLNNEVGRLEGLIAAYYRQIEDVPAAERALPGRKEMIERTQRKIVVCQGKLVVARQAEAETTVSNAEVSANGTESAQPPVEASPAPGVEVSEQAAPGPEAVRSEKNEVPEGQTVVNGDGNVTMMLATGDHFLVTNEDVDGNGTKEIRVGDGRKSGTGFLLGEAPTPDVAVPTASQVVTSPAPENEAEAEQTASQVVNGEAARMEAERKAVEEQAQKGTRAVVPHSSNTNAARQAVGRETVGTRAVVPHSSNAAKDVRNYAPLPPVPPPFVEKLQVKDTPARRFQDDQLMVTEESEAAAIADIKATPDIFYQADSQNSRSNLAFQEGDSLESMSERFVDTDGDLGLLTSNAAEMHTIKAACSCCGIGKGASVPATLMNKVQGLFDDGGVVNESEVEELITEEDGISAKDVMRAMAHAQPDDYSYGKSSCLGCCGTKQLTKLVKKAGKERRRLASWESPRVDSNRTARRLASMIPLSMEEPTAATCQAECPEVPALEPANDSSNLSLGVLSSVVVCAGCLITRYYRTIKNTLAGPRKEL